MNRLIASAAALTLIASPALAAAKPHAPKPTKVEKVHKVKVHKTRK